MRISRSVQILLGVAFLAGCADGTAIPIGAKRYAPTSPAMVQLYATMPASYEIVGLVKAESSIGATSQDSMDYALDELKKQAAGLGANGVVINGDGVRTIGSNTSFDRHGRNASTSDVTAQVVSGTAIIARRY